MSARREAPAVTLPPGRRAPWWLWLVALVAHIPVLWILDATPRGYDPDVPPLFLTDPLIALSAPAEVEMVEDLIVAAFNDARTKVEQHVAAEMSKLTGGLQLPPGLKLPF